MAISAHNANALLPGSRKLIERHFEEFERIAGLARKSLLAGELGTSAAYVQVVAYYAWFHPTGLFASPELEEILSQIGKSLPAVHPELSPNSQAPAKKILHVLTEVHSLGGHTRLTWRWIRGDANRNHSVALTRQGATEVPEPLRTATEESGGKILYLDRNSGGLLARAQELRRLAADADQVVLHIHPYDVIPSLAFADRSQRPPLAFLNHNDHVFWIGGSTADQIAEIRDSGRRLSQDRRGIPESRSTLLPIPLEENAAPIGRSAARQKLGLPEDAVIILTVAAAYKYNAPAGAHFTDALLPVIQKYPNVMLLAIGPAERDEWASAANQASGRIKVLGRRADAEVFYQAADIYLDSFPFSSLTSFLEAGSYGIPLVSYRAHSAEAEILCGDDPALSGLMKQPRTMGEFQSEVCQLVEDGKSRTALGKSTREAILDCHMNGGWSRFVEALYSRCETTSVGDLQDENRTCRKVTELDADLAQIFEISGLTNDVGYIFRNTVGLFPFKERMRIWRDVFGCDWRHLPLSLLADQQKVRVKLAWSQLMKLSAKN
jgi:hypothetical protein